MEAERNGTKTTQWNLYIGVFIKKQLVNASITLKLLSDEDS
jgi:hypothetical protein